MLHAGLVVHVVALGERVFLPQGDAVLVPAFVQRIRLLHWLLGRPIYIIHPITHVLKLFPVLIPRLRLLHIVPLLTRILFRFNSIITESPSVLLFRLIATKLLQQLHSFAVAEAFLDYHYFLRWSLFILYLLLFEHGCWLGHLRMYARLERVAVLLEVIQNKAILLFFVIMSISCRVSGNAWCIFHPELTKINRRSLFQHVLRWAESLN